VRGCLVPAEDSIEQLRENNDELLSGVDWNQVGVVLSGVDWNQVGVVLSGVDWNQVGVVLSGVDWNQVGVVLVGAGRRGRARGAGLLEDLNQVGAGGSGETWARTGCWPAGGLEPGGCWWGAGRRGRARDAGLLEDLNQGWEDASPTWLECAPAGWLPWVAAGVWLQVERFTNMGVVRGGAHH
jgi:hypothetical protein